MSRLGSPNLLTTWSTSLERWLSKHNLRKRKGEDTFGACIAHLTKHRDRPDCFTCGVAEAFTRIALARGDRPNLEQHDRWQQAVSNAQRAVERLLGAQEVYLAHVRVAQDVPPDTPPSERQRRIREYAEALMPLLARTQERPFEPLMKGLHPLPGRKGAAEEHALWASLAVLLHEHGFLDRQIGELLDDGVGALRRRERVTEARSRLKRRR